MGAQPRRLTLENLCGASQRKTRLNISESHAFSCGSEEEAEKKGGGD